MAPGRPDPRPPNCSDGGSRALEATPTRPRGRPRACGREHARIGFSTKCTNASSMRSPQTRGQKPLHAPRAQHVTADACQIVLDRPLDGRRTFASDHFGLRVVLRANGSRVTQVK